MADILATTPADLRAEAARYAGHHDLVEAHYLHAADTLERSEHDLLDLDLTLDERFAAGELADVDRLVARRLILRDRIKEIRHG